jgi:hypothetical protein
MPATRRYAAAAVSNTKLEPPALQSAIMQKLLILLGLVLLAAGLAWPWLRRLPFGRLPGDIQVVREGFSFSFPIVTCLVVSIVVSLLLWLFRR